MIRCRFVCVYGKPAPSVEAFALFFISHNSYIKYIDIHVYVGFNDDGRKNKVKWLAYGGDGGWWRWNTSGRANECALR